MCSVVLVEVRWPFNFLQQAPDVGIEPREWWNTPFWLNSLQTVPAETFRYPKQAVPPYLGTIPKNRRTKICRALLLVHNANFMWFCTSSYVEIPCRNLYFVFFSNRDRFPLPLPPPDPTLIAWQCLVLFRLRCDGLSSFCNKPPTWELNPGNSNMPHFD